MANRHQSPPYHTNDVGGKEDSGDRHKSGITAGAKAMQSGLNLTPAKKKHFRSSSSDVRVCLCCWCLGENRTKCANEKYRALSMNVKKPPGEPFRIPNLSTLAVHTTIAHSSIFSMFSTSLSHDQDYTICMHAHRATPFSMRDTANTGINIKSHDRIPCPG